MQRLTYLLLFIISTVSWAATPLVKDDAPEIALIDANKKQSSSGGLTARSISPASSLDDSHIELKKNLLYPFDTNKQEAQFHHLLQDLRCVVCQNQDLLDSNAGLAKDLRQEVYRLVKDNHSDQEITQYLTERYGDFILFRPPVKSITLLLWFGPALFFIWGMFIFLRTCLKRRAPKDAVTY